MGDGSAHAGQGVTLEGGVHRSTPTSSISLIHRSMPSKDQRLVMSYTRRIPCKGNAGITRPRRRPDGRGLVQAWPYTAPSQHRQGQGHWGTSQTAVRWTIQFTQQAASWETCFELSSCVSGRLCAQGSARPVPVSSPWPGPVALDAVVCGGRLTARDLVDSILPPPSP